MSRYSLKLFIMKKMSFSNIKDMLSRDEMRQVKGGSGGTCGFKNPHGNGAGNVICGVSKSAAMSMAANWSGYWCCTSCAGNGGSASYC
jgi:hypothetical protein